MKIILAIDGTELQVSDCDFVFLSKYNWGPRGNGYYQCTSKSTWRGHKINSKSIHWVVAQLMGLKIPEDFEIDHIDRNKANNQRPNLRAVSRNLQMYNTDMNKTNTSGYTGVSFDKRKAINPWKVQITINNKNKHLGYFKTAKEASEVYQFAKKLRDDAEIKRCEEVINENINTF